MPRPRYALTRRIIGFAAGFTITLGIIVATELSTNRPNSGELLGPLDLVAYCDQGDEPLMAALRTEDAYGWRCVGRRNGIFGFDEIDFDAACRHQYGRHARAVTNNPDAADSWECIVR